MTPKSVLGEGEAAENLTRNPDNPAADGDVSWVHTSLQLVPIPVSITFLKKKTKNDSQVFFSSSLKNAVFSALQSCFQVGLDKD